MNIIDIELIISRATNGSATASLRVELPASRADLAEQVPLALDEVELQALGGDPKEYGECLTDMVFSRRKLREAWHRARGFAENEGSALRVRLVLQGDEALHAIRWELLQDPINNIPLTQSEHVRLSRFLSSDHLGDVQAVQRPDLHAVVAVANPRFLQTFRLPPIDVASEVVRVRKSLGDIPTIILDGRKGRPAATVSAIAAALRNSAHILYLVCHGVLVDNRPYLYLEREEGEPEHPIAGDDLVKRIVGLGHRPLLVVLASCQSAGDNYQTLAAIGPQFARAGVGAVIALQGNAPIELVAQLSPRLFSELRRDGQIDRALAAARAALPPDSPWWIPVLWMAVRDGALWTDKLSTPVPAETKSRARIQALQADHTRFMRDRLSSFVGRKIELTEIQKRIAEKLSDGGYVTLTGQAGQGKSSIIAKLIEISGIDSTVYHFIPFNPGPDHQISILRNVIARLILKYDLPDVYLYSETRASLRDALPKVLTEIAKSGNEEVVFIDGLDQLEDDPSGERDLTFLPTDVPSGVVFVLSTRPNDTLRPLELLKPRYEYQLPNLSRSDFDLVLAHRGVTLDLALTDRFYTVMQANALYLDLVAKELGQREFSDPEEIIRDVADNPDNLFSLAMARLKRQRDQWHEIIKPVLGILLVTREPVGFHSIRNLLAVNSEILREGLQRLGGLIAVDEGGRYYIYHLKFQEFLYQESSIRPHVFDSDEIKTLHQKLANWCEGETHDLGEIWQDTLNNPVEQERRLYSRNHYITHLYLAKNRGRLSSVLDEGIYGRFKIRHDPSTWSYVQDIDKAQQSLLDQELSLKEQLDLLPNIFRYALLRNSLSNRDAPDSVIEVMMLVGWEQAAIGKVQQVTNRQQKADLLRNAAIHIGMQPGRLEEGQKILMQARDIARTITDKEQRIGSLASIAIAFTKLEDKDEAKIILNESTRMLQVINEIKTKIQAMSEIATVHTQIGQTIDGEILISNAIKLSEELEESDSVVANKQIQELWSRSRYRDRTIKGRDSISLIKARASFVWEMVILHLKLNHSDSVDMFTTVKDIELRSSLLGGLAIAYAYINLSDQSRVLLGEAAFISRRITESTPSDAILAIRMLGYVAIAYAQSKQITKADLILDELLASAGRIIAYGTQARAIIAIVQSQLGYWEEALITAREFKIVSELRRLIQDYISKSRLAEQSATIYIFNNEWPQACAYGALALFYARAAQVADEIVHVLTSEYSVEQIDVLQALAITFSRAGQLDIALSTVGLIKDDELRASTLDGVFQSLTETGRWDLAITTARRTSTPENSLLKLCNISQILANIGCAVESHALVKEVLAEVEETANGSRQILLEHSARVLTHAIQKNKYEPAIDDCLLLAREISNHRARIFALCQLSQALVLIGHSTKASQIVGQCNNEISKKAEAIESDFNKSDEVFLVQNNELNDTEQVLDKTEIAIVVFWAIDQALRQNAALTGAHDTNFGRGGPELVERRDMLLWNAAQDFVEDQSWEAAVVMVRAIEDIQTRSIALQNVGLELLNHKLEHLALSIFDEALELARTIEDADMRDITLYEMAQDFVQVACWEEALSATLTISNLEIRVFLFWALSEALLNNNELIRARTIINELLLFVSTINDVALRDTTLLYSTDILIKLKDWEAALEAAGRIVEYDLRVTVLNEILKTLAAFGLFSVLDSVADNIIELNRVNPNNDTYDIRHKHIVSIFIQRDKLDVAIETANLIKYPWLRDLAFRDITQALVKAKIWEKAVTLAGMINNSSLRDSTLHETFLGIEKYCNDRQKLDLVQRYWRNAETRNDILQALPITISLISKHPSLSSSFLEGLKWVDGFLKI